MNLWWRPWMTMMSTSQMRISIRMEIRPTCPQSIRSNSPTTTQRMIIKIRYRDTPTKSKVASSRTLHSLKIINKCLIIAIPWVVKTLICHLPSSNKIPTDRMVVANLQIENSRVIVFIILSRASKLALIALMMSIISGNTVIHSIRRLIQKFNNT